VTSVILPDPGLAAAIAPRRAAMTALTMGQGSVVPP